MAATWQDWMIEHQETNIMVRSSRRKLDLLSKCINGRIKSPSVLSCMHRAGILCQGLPSLRLDTADLYGVFRNIVSDAQHVSCKEGSTPQ